MKILIKNGHVIDPANGIDEVTNIFIDNGVIAEVGVNSDLEGIEMEIIDASGKIVAPGLVDMHVHLREPGQEYKEDIESGTRAAVFGGVTSVACMPNTNPVCDNETVVNYIKSRAAEVGYANVYPVGAVSKGQEGKLLAEIGEMAFAGAVAVSDDGHPVENSGLMRRAIEYSGMFDVVVISHCEDMALGEGDMNEGAVASAMGLRGISRAAEEVMAARDAIIAEAIGGRVHIAHISTKGTVELIRQAKKRGVRITCETCPHYFALTEDACKDFNTNAKMNPPLRTAEDVEAIKEGLADGTIDCIVTDHAPHHPDEKECEFGLAKNGIVGLETSLGLGIKYLVKEGVLTMSQLIEKMALNPSRILGISKGTLSPGHAADIVIFDPDKEWTVDINKLHSKGKNSPYDGFELFGKPEYVLVGGEIVINQGELMK
ncbi:MAG: dihydroorotase [Clostridiales bacterium]|nr:dihydroorotase [Clostridiales bacterium]